ncbi:uncharacterized protein YecE (DUF72 family) [Aeromicrobium tamlense]|uniref:Uncharacterized protein YecE (DUF72 family) n=1 Tax=Aeromicrobium tamlense TaxID=375541 RepID=A0ABX2SLP6_9ACTN|nr:uncharacterized protein YecE (DUF72 family) [Aeromicrobium tamlense]
MSRLLIGVSGWSYDGWRGDFYPKGLPGVASSSTSRRA